MKTNYNHSRIQSCGLCEHKGRQEAKWKNWDAALFTNASNPVHGKAVTMWHCNGLNMGNILQNTQTETVQGGNGVDL